MKYITIICTALLSTHLAIFSFAIHAETLLIKCAPFIEQTTYTTKELRSLYQQSPQCWPKPTLDIGIKHRELGLLPMPKFPTDNQPTMAKVALGKKLFNDPQLSRSRQIACASCHDRDLGWADGRQFSFGHNRLTGKRNAPSIENTAYYTSQFWDGRATTLEQQSLMPITDPVEMNFTLDELAERLNKDAEYPALFLEAFGQSKVTTKHIAQAIATFERTIISRYSDFDRFLHAHNEKTPERRSFMRQQLSDEAISGLHLFRTQARCLNCHNGPEMSDSKFHNIGLTFYQRKLQDLGRYQVTHDINDAGKIRTPGLRGVFNTKPWMHNGIFADMTGLLNFYNAGGFHPKKVDGDLLSPLTSTHLKPLKLNQQQLKDLEAFLHSITSHSARGSSHIVLKYIETLEEAK